MKTCTKCHAEKHESEFFFKDKKTGRLHTQCKSCYKDHRKSYYAQHYAKYKTEYRERANIQRAKLRTEYRTSMLEYLSDKSCVICGESDIRVLEFDHLDPTIKSFNISQAVKLSIRWDSVLLELKKCRILCANCHKKHTASQANWYKNI